MTNGREQIHAVFASIRTAAMLIEAIDPDAILESWEHQDAVMPFIDPTGYQKLLAGREDMARKKRLIKAAQAFLKEWNAVKGEALAAEDQHGQS